MSDTNTAEHPAQNPDNELPERLFLGGEERVDRSEETERRAPEGSGEIPVVNEDNGAPRATPVATLASDELPNMVDGHSVNSVDATIGQPLVERVQLRKAELEQALALIPEDDVRAREPIDLALSTIATLLTGDLKNVPAVVASDMNLWLERNKHLAERAIDPTTGEKAPLPTLGERQVAQAQATPPEPAITDGTVTGPYVKPADSTVM